MFAFGFALQHVLLNRTLGRDMLPPLLVTFGLSIIIQNGLLQVFSADSQRLRSGAIETASIPLGGGIAVGVVPLLTLLSAIAVIVFLNCSSTARRSAAPSAPPPTISKSRSSWASITGASSRWRWGSPSWWSRSPRSISALRANFDPTIGPARLLYAFEAVIIGGLGSLWGTLAGGIVIGLAQTIGARINPEWQILAGHLAFLVVLVLRPRGLFPRAQD